VRLYVTYHQNIALMIVLKLIMCTTYEV